MQSVRVNRINAEMQKAIAEIISNRLRDPDLDGLIISVTYVDTASDLSQAKVGISVLSNDPTENLVVAKLNQAKGFVRKELGKLVRLRTLPELLFYVDNSYERSERLMKLIDKVSLEDK